MNFKKIIFLFLSGFIFFIITPGQANAKYDLCKDLYGPTWSCENADYLISGKDCLAVEYATEAECAAALNKQKSADIKAAQLTPAQIQKFKDEADYQKKLEAMQPEAEAQYAAQKEAVKKAMAEESLKAAGMVCDCSKNGGQCKDDFTLVQDAIDYCMSCGLPPPKEFANAEGCPLGSKEIGPFFCSCGSGDKAVCSPYDTFTELEAKCAKTCGRGNGPCPTDVSGSLKKLQKDAKALNPAGFAFGTAGVLEIIGKLISFLMFPIGMIAMALYIWAGFLWMTAQGNSENVGKATSILVWTTLGVVITMASYLIVKMVFTEIL